MLKLSTKLLSRPECIASLRLAVEVLLRAPRDAKHYFTRINCLLPSATGNIFKKIKRTCSG